MSLKFNGKDFKPGDFEKSMNRAIMNKVEEAIRTRFETIRHPDTGEFPVLFFTGENLADIRVRIEASNELLQIISERITSDSSFDDIKEIIDIKNLTPKAFLSYAHEDKSLASQIANKLQESGIDTWWDDWCISAGESFRQKIDEGIESCTHFIVLLTPSSKSKPWVNQEMDAGLVKKLSNNCKFIVLRHKLEAKELPPLLSSLKSPEIRDVDQDISVLINDIHGITKKPKLGPVPNLIKNNDLKTGYSAAATEIAKVFVNQSQNGLLYDVQLDIDELKAITNLSRDDIVDALHELSEVVNVRSTFQSTTATGKEELYVRFDKYWKDWNPEEDALRLATDLINDEKFPSSSAEISRLYDWEARRLNPAMAYLINRELIYSRKALGSAEWLTLSVEKTDNTRRFVKSRTL